MALKEGHAALVRAEIDLSAIEHNLLALKHKLHNHVRFMAVIKANAYGHGAVKVARQVLQSGADYLGAARLMEGIELRKAGIDAPILIFGYTDPSQAKVLAQYRLSQTISFYETAKALSDAKSPGNPKIKVHLKVDTGMGRLGIFPQSMDSCIEEIQDIIQLKELALEGIYTHFASADSLDKSFAREQFKRFMQLLNALQTQGIHIPLKHAANSAAIIDLPETHLDMVRAGIALYGLYPSPQSKQQGSIRLKPAMSLKSKIIHLKKVPPGFKVSYGSTYTTQKPTIIATIPIGYADGFNRLLSSRGYVLVRGEKAPIVGRVCMDMTMIDVGHIPNVQMQDEVVLIGTQRNAVITADDIAEKLDTINYEIVSSIMARVPRVYIC